MQTKILKDRPTSFGGAKKIFGGGAIAPPCPSLATGLLVIESEKVGTLLFGTSRVKLLQLAYSINLAIIAFKSFY